MVLLGYCRQLGKHGEVGDEVQERQWIDREKMGIKMNVDLYCG